MLLAFVIIIIITGLAILFSIYSMFLPFVQTFGDVVNYNIAYYGAIGAVERGELVLKYRGPGFEGSGGWLNQDVFGKPSDIVLSGFSILVADKNGMKWSINSRTTRIPNVGEGNVDRDFWMGATCDYNKLDYKGVETFLLSIDSSDSSSSYSITGIYDNVYGGNSITGKFILPQKAFLGFGNNSGGFLCNNSSLDTCDPDQDGLYDDIVVDWSLKGYYNGMQFFIMPNESVTYYGNEKTVENGDTTIRESNVNSGSDIIFSTSKNIFNVSSSNPETQNVISNDNSISGDNFDDILSIANYTGLQLKFALVNLLSSFSGNIYPFLEYYFEFDQDVADRFYTIEGNGRKGDYDIKIIIKKPTFEETVAGSFTVVF